MLRLRVTPASLEVVTTCAHSLGLQGNVPRSDTSAAAWNLGQEAPRDHVPPQPC